MTPTLIADLNVRWNGDADRAAEAIQSAIEALDGSPTPVYLKSEILTDAGIALDCDYQERYWSRRPGGYTEHSERFRDVIARKVTSEAAYKDLLSLFERTDVPLMLSAYDVRGYEFAAQYADALKIASCHIAHRPLIRHVIALCMSYDLDLYADQGGATIGEVEWYVREASRHDVQPHIGHSPMGHPARPEDHRLGTLATLRQCFPDATVGLSHHGDDMAPLFMALAMGAEYVEVGIADDTEEVDQDISTATAIGDLPGLCRRLADAGAMLGGSWHDLDCEHPRLASSPRPGLVASEEIPAGKPIHLGNVRWAFPDSDHHRFGGIPVSEWDNVVGLRVAVTVRKDNPITWGHLGR